MEGTEGAGIGQQIMTPENSIEWVSCRDKLPPWSIDVETKIDDEQGVRNVAVLRLYRNLWWLPDKSMYVYYNPTHWRSIGGAKPPHLPSNTE